jgi:hypothetical protein
VSGLVEVADDKGLLVHHTATDVGVGLLEVMVEQSLELDLGILFDLLEKEGVEPQGGRILCPFWG